MEADEIRIASISDELLDNIDSSLDAFLASEHLIPKAIDLHVSRVCSLVEQFSPAPQYLDRRLRHFILKLVGAYSASESSPELRCAYCTVLYTFTKVRGYKAVSLCLDSDIYLIDKVVTLIEHSIETSAKISWQERFFLLMWLSILILSPFPLESMNAKHDIAPRVWAVCCHFLGNAGKESDIAPFLTARMVSRVDCREYLAQIFENIAHTSSTEQTGYLATLNSLLKIAKTEQIREYADVHARYVIDLSRENVSSTVLKLCVKNMGKLGKVLAFTEDTEPVEEILDTLFHHIGDKQTVIRSCVSRQIAKITACLPEDFREDVFGMLVSDLEIPNTQPDMAEIDLGLSIDQELINIEKYHGILLTIAEFARLQIMQQEWLNFIASLLHKTLFIEQHQLSHTTGSNVRDSSCFIAWSVAKKCRRIPLAAAVTIFKDLVLASCYDQDLMIRRAATAALQELVGRHGDGVFGKLLPESKRHEYKVKLIELLDFTTLGLTYRSFALSVKITQVLDGLMTTDFWDFLSKNGITAHDYEIRRLSASTLRELAEPDRCRTLVSSLIERLLNNTGGEYYALAELIPLAPLSPKEVNAIVSALKREKFDYHKDTYFRGEEILYILYALTARKLYALDLELYELVFNVIRLSHDKIVDKFVLLSSALEEVPAVYEDKWIYYTKHNNIATARAIGVSPIMRTRMDEILDLIANEKHDAAMRASLVTSVSHYLQRGLVAKPQQLLRVIEGLDDYTTTKQGDVGHLVRLSAIKLVAENPQLFQRDLHSSVELKLLRLACEAMDKVKYRALAGLSVLNVWEYTSLDSDAVFVDNEVYFTQLFAILNENFITNEESVLEFCKGFCFSAGAIHAGDLTVNSAFRAFHHHMEKVFDDTRKLALLNALLKILQAGAPQDRFGRSVKLQTTCLQLWVRILDMNVSLPSGLSLRTLFVRAYNLHLKTSNMSRITSAIHIFTHLFLRDRTEFADCNKRIVWISQKHPLPNARICAEKALLEIENY